MFLKISLIIASNKMKLEINVCKIGLLFSQCLLKNTFLKIFYKVPNLARFFFFFSFMIWEILCPI